MDGRESRFIRRLTEGFLFSVLTVAFQPRTVQPATSLDSTLRVRLRGGAGVTVTDACLRVRPAVRRSRPVAVVLGDGRPRRWQHDAVCCRRRRIVSLQAPPYAIEAAASAPTRRIARRGAGLVESVGDADIAASYAGAVRPEHRGCRGA